MDDSLQLPKLKGYKKASLDDNFVHREKGERHHCGRSRVEETTVASSPTAVSLLERTVSLDYELETLQKINQFGSSPCPLHLLSHSFGSLSSKKRGLEQCAKALADTAYLELCSYVLVCLLSI